MELKPILDIPDAELLIRCTLFEDNKDAEKLANIPKNRPRTKHIAVKYHHFREVIKSKILMVERVDTIDQLAGIFTKPLATISLEYLRNKIMSWTVMLSHGNMDILVYINTRKISIGH